MNRIFQLLNYNPHNYKHVRLAVMVAFVVIAHLGLFMERSYAQNPPAEEATTEQSEAAAEGEDGVTEKATEAAEEVEPVAADDSISILSYFLAGGWAMYPLLAASIIMLMIILERLYYYFFAVKISHKSFQQDLSDSLQSGGLKGAEKTFGEYEEYEITGILKEGMAVASNDPELFTRGVEREAGNLIQRSEWGLAVLAAVSTIAPLIGFLGTVSGMIGAFDAIANADTVNAKVVAGGIKEALITTATGLIVGIPAMVFFQYFTGKVNGFATDIEQAANSIYKELLRLQGKQSGQSSAA